MLVAHRPVTVVAVHRRLRLVDRQLQVVGADAVAVGVGVAEQAPEQHLVRARTDAGDHVGGLEGGLLDLGEVVVRVAVEDHAADR